MKFTATISYSGDWIDLTDSLWSDNFEWSRLLSDKVYLKECLKDVLYDNIIEHPEDFEIENSSFDISDEDLNEFITELKDYEDPDEEKKDRATFEELREKYGW